MNAESILQYIRSELDEIYSEANLLAEAFWDQLNSDLREQKLEKKSSVLTTLGTRVRRRGVWTSMEWLRARFYGPVGNRKRYWAHVTRGNRDKLPISAIGKTTEWDRENYPVIEEQYSQLRKRQKGLKDMLKALKAYSKNHDPEMYEELKSLNKAESDSEEG